MSAEPLNSNQAEELPREAAAAPDVFQAALVDENEFVDAELVTPSPGPLAFGMRAMFAIMAMAAVQFSLMNYLGMLPGLFVGIVACAVVTTVLIFAAILLGAKPGSSTMEHLDRLAIRLVFGIVLLFFGTLLAGGGKIVYNVLETQRLKWQTEQLLGFTYDETPVWRKNFTTTDETGLKVAGITAAGALDQVGVKQGEILVVSGSAEEFARNVAQQRGKTVDVLVATPTVSSVAQTIDDCPQRTVTIQIPP